MSKTLFANRLVLAIALLVAAAASADEDVNAARPNIIVIMVDDMGYAGPSIAPYSNPNYKTPGMDQLAQEGLRFSDFSFLRSRLYAHEGRITDRTVSAACGNRGRHSSHARAPRAFEGLEKERGYVRRII